MNEKIYIGLVSSEWGNNAHQIWGLAISVQQDFDRLFQVGPEFYGLTKTSNGSLKTTRLAVDRSEYITKDGIAPILF